MADTIAKIIVDEKLHVSKSEEGSILLKVAAK